MRQTDPFNPCSNAAEKELKYSKKGLSMRLVKSGAPKRLWDDSLEL